MQSETIMHRIIREYICFSYAILRMQHFGQNKKDFAYQVYLFRVATKGKSGGFI